MDSISENSAIADVHQDIMHDGCQRIQAFAEMDLTKGQLIVSGKETSWVGSTPWECGISKEKKDPSVCAPRISDRAVSISKA